MNTELGFVIVTHGEFGKELLRVANYIMDGRLGRFEVVKVPFMSEMGATIPPHSKTPFTDRRDLLKAEIGKAIRKVDQGAGIIIFTDIIGGTSFNVALELMEKGQGVVLSGVNLPMLLKAASIRQLPFREAAEQLKGRSRQAIDCRLPADDV